MSKLRPVSILATALLALVTTACSNTLIYGERTSFSLGIDINDSIATPLNVNMGFNRSVAGLVPPTKRPETGNEVNGEAANMFSGFDLRYTKGETNALSGKLMVKTQFASGASAVEVSNSPALAALITGKPLGVDSKALTDRKLEVASALDSLAGSNEGGAKRLAARYAGGQPNDTASNAVVSLKIWLRSADESSVEKLADDIKLMGGTL